jgi:23S rRNA (uracil1939-C5)-methyltransferase
MKKLLKHIKLQSPHSSGRMMGHCGTSRIYVDNGIPGECVDVAIDRVQRGYRYGKVISITEPSEHRQVPFCAYAALCGGCPWQHIAYEEQLRLKRDILQGALQKYGIATPAIPPVLPSPLQQGYRNKSEYTFAAQDCRKQANALGFHVQERRDTICQVDECFLQPPIVQETAALIQQEAIAWELPFYDYHSRGGWLRSLQLRTTTQGDLMVLLEVTASAGAPLMDFLQHLTNRCPAVTSWFYCTDRDQPVHFAGNSYLTERSGGLTFRYSPLAFYQPNPLQAENLCAQVRALAALTGSERVYDLYTGIGSLACHVAGDAAAVIGIEGNASAIADANYNAAANGITNAQFFVGDILQTFNEAFIARYGRPDVVILDPPRAGTLIEIKKTLLRAAPEKIIYVSCNPVSLAFDLKQLCEKYRVAAIQPVDLFPHTHHVETIVLLEPPA